MQQHRAKPPAADRLRQWLLTRRHILHRADSNDAPHSTYATLLRHAGMACLGWTLTRAPLLFAVNPLPTAAAVAAPLCTPALVAGIALGLWQGAPHVLTTLLALLAGLLFRGLIALFFHPPGKEHAAQRRDRRHTLFRHCRLTLHRLLRGQAAPTEQHDRTSLEHLPLPLSKRTLAATVAAVVGSILHCARGGFAVYDLFGGILWLLLTPLACALFGFSLDALTGQTPRQSPRALLGHGAMITAVCFCLRGYFFLSISPATALLLALALRIARRNGMLTAVAAVVLGGLAIDADTIPPLLCCVVVFCLMHGVHERIALPVAALGGILALALGGRSIFLQLAPTLCVGILLYSMAAVRRARRPHQAASAQRQSYSHDATRCALVTERERCHRLTARISVLASALASLGETLLRTSDRNAQDALLPSPGERFSRDCGSISSLLRDILAEDAVTLNADDELSGALGQALRSQGAHFRHACVLSDEDRYIIRLLGCSPTHLHISPEQLHRTAQQVTDAVLSAPIYDSAGEEGGSYTLRSLATLAVECSYRSVAAQHPLPSKASPENKKSPHCGDSVRFFSDGQEHFYALLCDGMGTGEAAEAASSVSILILERLLRAGAGMDTALSLLNTYLCSRQGGAAEVSSTVDLLSLELFSGRARFVKSGAADTLILRNGMIYTVSSRSFPLGILAIPDVQITPFALQHGDCILMMSDGIMDSLSDRTGAATVTLRSNADGVLPQSRSDGVWLYSLLQDFADSSGQAGDADTLLRNILQGARDHGSCDDMTVAVLRVVEHP